MNKQLWAVSYSILFHQFSVQEKRKITMNLNNWFWKKVVPIIKNGKRIKGIFSYTPQGIYFYGVKAPYFKNTIGFFPKTLEIDILDFKKGMTAKDFRKQFLVGWKKIDF